MQNTLTTRYVFARHTDVSGKSYVQDHLVWDADRFFAQRRQDAQRLNAKQKPDKPRLANVEQITQDQYLKERTQ